MATAAAGFRRIYVWELPVRIYHWTNAICILILIVTGYVIGNPTTIEYSSEAYEQYWFGTVRFLHFVAAFVFFFNFDMELRGPKVLGSFRYVNDDMMINDLARERTFFLGKIDPELFNDLLFGIRISQFEPGLEQYPVELVLMDGFVHDSG